MTTKELLIIILVAIVGVMGILVIVGAITGNIDASTAGVLSGIAVTVGAFIFKCIVDYIKEIKAEICVGCGALAYAIEHGYKEV